MEDLNPSIQTGEQPRAGHDVEAMPVDPVLESPGTRRPMEELTAAAGGLSSGEQLAPIVNGSATMPEATVETTESSAANAGDTSTVPESRVVPKEQTVPPEAS